jgi:anti-sigma B factor antagonist
VSRRLGTPLVVERRLAGDLGATVLEVSGDLVVNTGEVLHEAVREALKGGSRHVVLELRRVSHIDTPGLALIHRLHMLCAEGGGQLTLVGMPERFLELTRHLRLDEELRFRASVQALVDDLPR